MRHRVDIDSEAGPSEVVVLADERANPDYVASELLAQAEHDEDAKVILITPDAKLASRVQERTEQLARELPRRTILWPAIEKKRRHYYQPRYGGSR